MNTNNIKILDNNMKYLDHKKESGVIGDDIDKRVSDLETKLKDMNILDTKASEEKMELMLVL